MRNFGQEIRIFGNTSFHFLTKTNFEFFQNVSLLKVILGLGILGLGILSCHRLRVISHQLKSWNWSHNKVEDSNNKAVGHHRHIFRPLILLKMPFKRLIMFFFQKILSSSNFAIFPDWKTFWIFFCKKTS